MFLLIALGTSE